MREEWEQRWEHRNQTVLGIHAAGRGWCSGGEEKWMDLLETEEKGSARHWKGEGEEAGLCRMPRVLF